MTISAIPVDSLIVRLRGASGKAAVWLFIATLAWAPFPLGGAIAWASDVQEMLVAACWVLWFIHDAPRWKCDRIIAGPLVLAMFVLGWAVVQIWPSVPATWAHPLWSMASETLGRPLASAVSLNPWHSEAEILKLTSYVMAGVLVYRMARRTEHANLLLNAVILIGGAYACYTFVLALSGLQQVNLFYTVPQRARMLAGPFMLHNSLATYMGMVTIAAVTRLFAEGVTHIRSGRGWRRLVESLLEFCFGRGALLVVGAVAAFAVVIASASRAGFVATMCGLAVLAVLGFTLVPRRTSRLWVIGGALAALLPLLVLVANGDALGGRFDKLVADNGPDAVRLSLWAAAHRMIVDAPWLGLGLGTFEDAYPLYATSVYPFVMDKAHCDYLEFAAGIGLPAAVIWWFALAWLAVLCLRGIYVRHRNRQFALCGLGATVIVAVHSSVDFSLQLPAVAILFATLLAIGVAQSISKQPISENAYNKSTKINTNRSQGYSIKTP